MSWFIFSFSVATGEQEGLTEGEKLSAPAKIRSQRNEPNPLELKLFLKAKKVRELSPIEAKAEIPVDLEGVVTMSNYRSLVLQDESGGVFVLYQNGGGANMPKPGEVWNIKGVTNRGAFSPIVLAKEASFIKLGALPPPQRPRWEQLLNGSLDAEWVEIEGVITAASDTKIDLLTADGMITIQERNFYPLLQEFSKASFRSHVLGSRIRIRGVYATSWDTARGRLHPGIIHLGNVTIFFDQAAPKNFEDVAMVKISDLWGFTSKSTALNRVRLKVQMRARSGDTYLVSDGKNSLRLISNEALDLVPGDWTEVIGFPRVGEISPFLLHPIVQGTRREKMPPPRVLEEASLPNVELDGQVVELKATVLSDVLRKEKRIMELQFGKVRFFAFIDSAGLAGDLLPEDTIVRVRGVYMAGNSGERPNTESFFELHLAEMDGLTVLRKPPWWTARRLFFLVSALFSGLVLVLVWVIVLRRQVAQRSALLTIEIHEKEHAESDKLLEEERARVARDLHDELGAGLTEIGMLSSLLKHPDVSDDARNRYVETLDEVSGTLVSGLDEIVWAVNPSYDSIQDSASYLWLYSQRMLKPVGIECRFEQGEDIPTRRFGSRRRHSLFLAFKEALNNVVRHSKASLVNFSINVENEAVVVVIADNGIGFDTSSAQAVGRDGLTSMRERMLKFDGDCLITSQPGQGTTIQLILPLRLS